jgi:NADH:ubiquinone oxidoreductase subunit F (NADH-binding)
MIEPREIPRLLAGWHPDRALTLAEHNAVHGELTGSVLRKGPELLDEIEASGLLGRGGAGFPAAVKLRAVASRRRTILLANGAEGEPASGKDACLLAYAPHLVLDGVSAAAAAIRADMAIVCVKESRPDALAALETAIAERSRVDRLQPVVVAVPADYVAGEESALVNFMNTGLALPTFTPPRPFERGVRGRPTLIQNVETLAHLALIARHGAGWYRALGPEEDPGSTLVTVDGAVVAPGIYEVECGTPLGSLVETAGGSDGPLQACLVGGYGGIWVGAEDALSLPLSHLTSGGLPNVGPGVITALGAGECGLRRTADIARYLADESAGQCGPCTFGLPAIADALDDIATGAAQPGTSRWVKWWAEQVQGRGACHHPDGAVRMVRSALRVFSEDLTRHETGEPCLAGRLPATVLSR